ncbi:MAG TPA: hypothetical protein VME86_05125 [Acidobacteriaceae bacterium]|nr:hypothetical protein [Acidobacteriaceae bacterium]
MKKFGVGLLALVFTFAAHAAKNSKTVDFPHPVQVGSATVPAGPVKITWTGTGSDAQLTFAAGSKHSVTVPAEIVAQKNPDTAISTISVNGASYLQSVELNDVTLVVRNAPTATQSGN